MSAILLMILSLITSAFASECDVNSPIMTELKSYKGRYPLGDCKIEFHLCESDRNAFLPSYMEEKLNDRTKFWLGDLLITHKDGRSLYVPIYSAESRLANTSISLQTSRKDISYSYKDKISDPISGFKEIYEVNFSRKQKRIEVSMKNSVESRKTPIRSLFFPNLKIKCAE